MRLISNQNARGKHKHRINAQQNPLAAFFKKAPMPNNPMFMLAHEMTTENNQTNRNNNRMPTAFLGMMA
jgi:hypothetical protein